MCVWEREFECIHVTLQMCRLEDKLGCWSSPSILFKIGSLADLDVAMAGQPLSFQWFSCPSLPSLVGMLRLQACATMSNFMCFGGFKPDSDILWQMFTHWEIFLGLLFHFKHSFSGFKRWLNFSNICSTSMKLYVLITSTHILKLGMAVAGL